MAPRSGAEPAPTLHPGLRSTTHNCLALSSLIRTIPALQCLLDCSVPFQRNSLPVSA
jgi:hypothetical protein